MKEHPDIRSLALEALEELERRRAFAEALLNGLLVRNGSLDTRDRSFLTQLVYGVLRWRNRLDAHLAAASNRPLEKIHRRLLQVLRLGAYQILFLDRVPDRAAVSESVELARRAGLGHAAGFVNAVLRSVAASGNRLPETGDPVEDTALLHGCPGWLARLWLHEYGPDGGEELCRAASRVPQVWLRVNTRRISRQGAVESLRREGIDAEPGGLAPEAVWVKSPGDPRRISLVLAGHAVVQDQGSQLVSHLVAPKPGWNILDACAAPGLKTTHLASLGGAGTRITALEIHPHRAKMLFDLVHRLGLEGVRIEVGRAELFRPTEPCDAVLVDAPCSGLGVLDRNPEAKWRLAPADLGAFPAIQIRILENVAEAVRPGGLLVYATCTTARAENEGVMEKFLATRADFRLEPPAGGPAARPEMTTTEGYFRTFPRLSAREGPESADGFFGARLRRAEDCR